MATATVDGHLHPVSLPLIDLRLLSQSELLSLSLCSSITTTTTAAAQNDDDDEVSTPKIDRSVFNESAGSRKQTFSRLRLAPRNSSQISPQFPSSASPEPLDEENSQIIAVLKSLLKIQSHSSYTVGNNGQLVPVQVQYKDYLNSNSQENKGLQNVPVDVVTFSLKKRKRGRPRKDENRRSDNCWVIESASKVNGCKGESNEINIPVSVVACETVKRRPGRPRKDDNRIICEYKVIESESESKVNDSKGASNLINVAVVNLESSQNIPVDVVACESRKRRRGRPRKDEYRNGNEFRIIEGESKVNENKGESNEIKVPVVSVESSPYIPVDVVIGETTKRRRGRPRKDDIRFQNEYRVVQSGNKVIQTESKNKEVILVGENKKKEMVIENKNGVVVDLVALGNVGDPFTAELRRRTEGIDEKEELLKYLDGLKGEWVSKRQKRKIVDASEFGDALPKGWKLMLCIKKKVEHVWLACRRYISPNGQQFASCKEVSSYMLSLFGLQEASQSNPGHAGDGDKFNDKMTYGNAADLMLKDGNNTADLVSCSPFPCIPKSTEHEQATELKVKSPGEGRRQEILKCHKCSMAFHKQDDLLHHLLSSHQVTTKSSRCSTSISEGVKIKDGKYECQLCHKLFEERHHCNGNLGGHIKNHGKQLGGVLTTHKGNEPVSVGVPSEVVETQETTGIDWDSFAENTSNCRANNEISSGLTFTKPKADGIVETHSDKYIHECNMLFHDEQIMMPNRNPQTSAQENFNKQARVSCITNDKVDKVKAATDITAAKHDVCSGVETFLSSSYSNKSFVLSDERDVSKSAIGGVNNFGQGRSPQNWSLALGGSNQPCVVDYSVKGASISSMEKQKQVIGSEAGFFPSNGMEKIFTCASIQDRNFTSAMEDGDINKDKFARDKGISASNYACTGLENAAAKVKEQGNFKGYSAVPIGLRCGSESNMNRVSTNNLAEAQQERTSASGFPSSYGNKPTFGVNNYLNIFSTSTLDQPKFDHVNRSENNVLTFGFGNKHTMNKPGQEGDSEVGLLNLFGSEKVFGFDNNLTKASAGKIEVSKLDEARNTNEQAHVVENSYRVYTGTVQQDSRLENSENVRNNEFSAFSNHGRSGVDVMAELFWRTDEDNILLSGFADTSSRLLQSSGCFPAFGTMSDKGENELLSIDEKFDSISGFEGLRSGSMEHMEYDFLTNQASSHSEVPKVLSYDAEISRGFDSSVWLDKEALPLLPKIGSRYQVTVCAWCRNEFNHEPVDTGAETGSVGFMCPTCKAKFSGNHSSL